MSTLLRRLVQVAVMVAVAGAAVPTPAGAVVGGRRADAGEWPWQVVMLVDGDVWCGGSLVAPDVVLTAAHCTDDTTPHQFQVVAGTVDISSNQSGQRRAVVEIDQHEEYDPGELRNDISLLHLAAPFELGPDVALVRLAGPDESAALTEAGDPATVTGFGAVGEDDDASDQLLEADIVTYDDQRCTQLYAEDGDAVFGDSEVCAGEDRGHIDACYGDSGGPLMVPADGGDAAFLQVGIVSWGAGCGQPLRPTVYTEVSAFADWLSERGVGPPGSEVFEATGARIPARGTTGKSADYPLTIDVEGFDGDVESVSVRLVGLAHERPEDLDIWLVSPEGSVITLLSDVGGRDDIEVDSVLVVDGASPATGFALDGQVSPSDREVDRERKSGANVTTELRDLVGEDPNGEWQLLVADDRSGASGTLASWKLTLR